MSDSVELTCVKKSDGKKWIASVNAYVKVLDYDFDELLVFQKANGFWVTGASKTYTSKDGESKYKELGRFRDPKRQEKFKKQVVDLFETYYKKYPNLDGPLKPKDEMDADCPF